MKSKTIIAFLPLVLLVSLVVGGWPGFATTARAAADQSDIRFDHALHAENDVECDSCHEDAASSRLGSDLLLPEMDTCADCHDVDDDEECGICHVNASDPGSYAELVSSVDLFSHAAHVESDMECARCHSLAGERMAMPAKSECRGCHVTAAGLQDCSVCHLEGAKLVPTSHSVGWNSWHGVEAGSDQESCSNCHAQVDCQDCHSGDNVRPRAHRLNFAFDHSVEARANEMECTTCHFDPGFCADCHRAYQILPANHSRADWILPVGDGGRHAIDALLEMESCVSCHDAGSASPICADCHGGQR